MTDQSMHYIFKLIWPTSHANDYNNSAYIAVRKSPWNHFANWLVGYSLDSLLQSFFCVFLCFFVIFIFLQTLLNNYTTRQNLYKVRSDRKSIVQGSPTSVFFSYLFVWSVSPIYVRFFFQLKYTIPLLGYIRILFCTSYCFRDMNGPRGSKLEYFCISS